MKLKKIISLSLIAIVIAITPLLVSWGVFGHEHINRSAVFALPSSSLQTFFYNHIDFITQESTVPDLRKYTLNDKAENPRHFIDMENFGSPDTLPATLAEAQKHYDEKFLQKNGTLPWYMQEVMEKLTKAFKEKRKTEILFLAADLGHYVGDAHMPLHTSANHDGQMTNQKGIHSFWESRLPELYGSNYSYHTGEAKLIDNVQKEAWRMVMDSHKLVDTLLLADKKLREKFGDNIWKKDEQGNILKNKFGAPLFSDDYAKAYHEALNGMVEKQMAKAIQATANLWYTAWVNAGRPDLSGLDPQELTKRNGKLMKQEVKLWKKGKLFGVESEKEF
jgi:hypothetical protein